MSRLTLIEGLLLNLEQKIPPNRRRLYLTRESALKRLQEISGQDFGQDVAQWKLWFKENPGKYTY